ncbi:hypothetical protein F5144DRAFT_588819 [Chaetomium tenue]|uniref:Uncharacterized protein n=1 Tax=Chaetomium tenue TaxID=1854479 RepID=A0ACB7PMH9_9PEZI|nr:hypothetical protein F5144DRAFT_588819 [Chaetomium globosum]
MVTCRRQASCCSRVCAPDFVIGTWRPGLDRRVGELARTAGRADSPQSVVHYQPSVIIPGHFEYSWFQIDCRVWSPDLAGVRAWSRPGTRAFMAADHDINRLPGILRLTPDTRRRIYLHAGVAYREYGSERWPGLYNLGESVVPDQRSIRGFFTFYGLLLSCRTIYAEASALLYSANRFIVRYQPWRSLSPLRALTPRTLVHLADLKIILNQTSCHELGTEQAGGACCGGGTIKSATPCSDDNHHHDLPLGKLDFSAEALFAEWHATAAYLAAHIIPGQLELTLVCDVHYAGVETAKVVLDSLHLLPRLKNCHIRLCGVREPRLQQLAQDAVLRARGIQFPHHSAASSVSVSPRLINLPRELQLRILEYTDLVTPHKEVIWSRKSYGYHIPRAPCYRLMGGCPPEFHYGCQFLRCWETPWPIPSNGCFCRRQHAAVSSRCRCWAPPTPLFLVCRALYSQANRVFYSQNRLIVIEAPYKNPYTPWTPGDYPYPVFAVSQFLRHVVPPHCLKYIRFLELVFSPFNHLSRPRDGHPALLDWPETLEWAKQELNLPALTLRLVMAFNDQDHPKGSREMTRAQGKEVLALYNLILLPVRRLDPAGGGLARFYAELVWPLRWTRWAFEKRYEEGGEDWLASKGQELKRRAEQSIMGERYERVQAVTQEPQESLWTWSSLSHLY